VSPEEQKWTPFYGRRTAELGRWLVDYLRGIVNGDFHIYYDHGDSQLPNVAAIKGFVGQAVSRGTHITDVDILVAKPNGEILFLIEIEETQQSPKKYIGTVFSVLLCNGFAVGTGTSQQHFYPTESSKLIIGGAVPTPMRLQKLCDVVHPAIANFTVQSTKCIHPRNVIFRFSDSIDSTVRMVRKTVEDLLRGFEVNDSQLEFGGPR